MSSRVRQRFRVPQRLHVILLRLVRLADTRMRHPELTQAVGDQSRFGHLLGQRQRLIQDGDRLFRLALEIHMSRQVEQAVALVEVALQPVEDRRRLAGALDGLIQSPAPVHRAAGALQRLCEPVVVPERIEDLSRAPYVLQGFGVHARSAERAAQLVQPVAEPRLQGELVVGLDRREQAADSLRISAEGAQVHSGRKVRIRRPRLIAQGFRQGEHFLGAVQAAHWLHFLEFGCERQQLLQPGGLRYTVFRRGVGTLYLSHVELALKELVMSAINC